MLAKLYGICFLKLNGIKFKNNTTLPKTISQHYRIPAEHPSLAGHFPGNPIVPGVILLDYTRRLLKHWKPAFTVTTIPQAKFHQRLHPEQNFSIQLTEKTPLLIKFECYTGDIKLASGILSIKPQR